MKDTPWFGVVHEQFVQLCRKRPARPPEVSSLVLNHDTTGSCR